MAKYSLVVLLSLCCLSCHEEPETSEGSGGSDAYVNGTGGSDSDVSRPPASSEGSKAPENEDSGFDSCPEVTYVLWEANGIKYTVTIDVFCEPIQNINLGCPGPVQQNH